MAATGQHSEQGGRVPRVEEALALYDRYARPLEQEHRGQYVAVSTEGDMLLDEDLLALARRARQRFGPGSYVFKVGDVAVDKLLCLTLS